MIIGFNTSYIDVISLKDKVELFKKLGCNAIEISFSDYPSRGRALNSQLGGVDLSSFKYISLHAPIKSGNIKIEYGKNKITTEILKQIQIWNNDYHFNTVVFHPDTVGDYQPLLKTGLPIAVENMDRMRTTATEIKYFEELFKKNDIGLVLDVNHAFTVSGSTKLADEFITVFKNWVKEIHLSGYEQFHEPLFITKQTEIINCVPKDVPIIIESTCDGLKEMEKEYQYIIDKLC